MRYFIIRGHPEGSLGKVGCAQSRSIEQLGALDHSTRSIGHQLQEKVEDGREYRNTAQNVTSGQSGQHSPMSDTILFISTGIFSIFLLDVFLRTGQRMAK